MKKLFNGQVQQSLQRSSVGHTGAEIARMRFPHKSAKKITSRATDLQSQRFSALHPTFQRHIHFHLGRRVKVSSQTARETWETDAMSACFIMYINACKRSLPIFPAVIAEYAVRQVLDVNRTVEGRHERDNPTLRLNPSCDSSPWQMSSERDNPALHVQTHLDFATWAKTLTRQAYKVLMLVISGERSIDVAALLDVSAGRVSQYRRMLREKWEIEFPD